MTDIAQRARGRPATPKRPLVFEDVDAARQALETALAALEGPPAAVIVANRVVGDSRVIKSAQSLRASGFATILFGRCNGGYRFYEDDGLTVFLSPTDDSALRKATTGDWTDWTVEFTRNVAGLAADTDWSVVLSHDMFGLPVGRALADASRARGCRLVWAHDIHEDVTGYDGILAQEQIAVMTAIEAEHVAGPDFLITVNEALAGRIAARHGLATPPMVVYNCPMLGGATRPGLREALGLAADAPLGVYLGRATAARGLDICPDLLAANPDLHLAIVANGQPAYLETLRKAAARLGCGDRLHIHPYVPHDEVVGFVRTVDFGLSLLNSYGNTEVAVPTKILEYAHAGVPVIASSTALQKKFVEENGLGVVVADNRDVAGVSEAIRRCLRDGRVASPQADAVRAAYHWAAQFQPVVERLRSGLAPDPARPRILQLPTNGSGQAGMLAAGLRRVGADAFSVSVAVASKFNYPVDRSWVVNFYDFNAMAALSRWALRDFEVLHYHSRPIFYSYMKKRLRYPSLSDLIAARLAGKKIVFSFRGGEARQLKAFQALSPFAWADEDDPSGFLSDPEKERYVAAVTALADIVTVPDPELGCYVPGARILPRVIDTGAWRDVGQVNETRPLVVHAPSRRGVKGTEHLFAAVEALRAEGLAFDFELVEDLDNAAARAVYERADVIVDQLRIGWYGVLAVEGMALGKTVISYIRDDLRHHLPDPEPIVVASPPTIRDTLRRVIADPALRRRTGAAARRFCETYHDHQVVARMLLEMYREPCAPRPVAPDFILARGREDGAALVKHLRFSQSGKKAPGAAAREGLLPNLRFGFSASAMRQNGKALRKFLRPGANSKGLFAPPYSKIVPRLLMRLGLR